jgi:hypothetical protein
MVGPHGRLGIDGQRLTSSNHAPDGPALQVEKFEDRLPPVFVGRRILHGDGAPHPLPRQRATSSITYCYLLVARRELGIRTMAIRGLSGSKDPASEGDGSSAKGSLAVTEAELARIPAAGMLLGPTSSARKAVAEVRARCA